MARAIELDPAAEKELDDAIEFLGSNSVAGRRLATAIDRAFSTLVDFPEAGKQVDGSLRSLYLPGTSYSMIYEVEPHAVRVLVFAHAARRPGYWRDRK